TRSASRKILPCSSGFTLRRIAEIRPPPSMMNVLRSEPMYFFPIHAFLHPDAIRVNNFFVGIGQERKGQLIFLDKLFVACWRINAHAEDFRSRTQFAPSIPHATRLDSASRRIVLRIKIKNDGGCAKISETDFLAGAEITTNREGAKVRCPIAN